MADSFPGEGYDLVCFFDCLHDMGVPLAAASRAREALAEGGTVLLVEPMAGDDVAENLNPVSRLFYAGSVALCTPNSLSQDGAMGLGAQAGAAHRGAHRGGLHPRGARGGHPFNLILEVRP